MSLLYRFEHGKHTPPVQWKRSGKPEWPNMLEVVLSRRDALEVIGMLARQLERPDNEPIVLTWPGELSSPEEG